MKDKVRNFIGLAGANLGLTACTGGNLIPTCSDIDGFNPGVLPSSGPSKFMASLNSNLDQSQQMFIQFGRIMMILLLLNTQFGAKLHVEFLGRKVK